MKSKVLHLEFICMDCGHDTLANEYYMLKNEVWLEAHNSYKGMLCIGCVEGRLGRRLCKKDFAEVMINDPKISTKSKRLINRLTR